MDPIKYKLRAAHDDVSTHHVKTERTWYTDKNDFSKRSRGIWLEALPVRLTGSSIKGKLTAEHIPNPFRLQENLLQYWNAPKIFIIQRIYIDHFDTNTRFGLQIGEKNYHTFSASDGLHVCDVGQEYERGLSLMAPQYFQIYCSQDEAFFIATLQGIFLREIC